MKYPLLGAITKSGQRLSPPGLESWMAEIGGWYEKYATTGNRAAQARGEPVRPGDGRK